MSVFEDLRNGKTYDIRDAQYIKEAHGEMKRCRRLCWEINNTDPDDREKIITLEKELFCGTLFARCYDRRKCYYWHRLSCNKRCPG